jgi:hypothetical protein
VTQVSNVINTLLLHPHIPAKQVAFFTGLTLKGAAATCSRLHRDGVLTAEAVWCTVKPTQRRIVLFYSINPEYVRDGQATIDAT